MKPVTLHSELVDSIKELPFCRHQRLEFGGAAIE
jgi:hypothetical protein